MGILWACHCRGVPSLYSESVFCKIGQELAKIWLQCLLYFSKFCFQTSHFSQLCNVKCRQVNFGGVCSFMGAFAKKDIHSLFRQNWTRISRDMVTKLSFFFSEFMEPHFSILTTMQIGKQTGELQGRILVEMYIRSLHSEPLLGKIGQELTNVWLYCCLVFPNFGIKLVIFCQLCKLRGRNMNSEAVLCQTGSNASLSHRSTKSDKNQVMSTMVSFFGTFETRLDYSVNHEILGADI